MPRGAFERIVCVAFDSVAKKGEPVNPLDQEGLIRVDIHYKHL